LSPPTHSTIADMDHVSTVNKKMQFAASWEPVPPVICLGVMIMYPGVRKCPAKGERHTQDKEGLERGQRRRKNRQERLGVDADA
jgi:hypothetical protein